MSKNHSLDTRTIYQIGLVIIGLASCVAIGFSMVNLFNLLQPTKTEPAIKIRQQQLQTALDRLEFKQAID